MPINDNNNNNSFHLINALVIYKGETYLKRWKHN